MKRRAFLALTAAAPIAALAAWRPPAFSYVGDGAAHRIIGVDWARGPSMCIVTVRHASDGWSSASLGFGKTPRYVRIDVRERSVIVQIRNDLREQWVDHFSLPTGDVPQQVRVDELWPISQSRALFMRFLRA